MSSNLNDAKFDQDSKFDESALEALLRDARYTAPQGLAARLAKRALDPEQGKILFWSDVERVSRTLVGKVAVAAVLAAGLALGVAFNSTPEIAPTADTAWNGSSNASDSDVVDFSRLVSPTAADSLVIDSASGVGSSGDSEER